MQNYPEFLELYKDIALFRTDPKELITIFSEALSILDRNTVRYMIDEQNQQLLEKDQLLIESRRQHAEDQQRIAEKEQRIAESQKQLTEKDLRIAELKAQLRQFQK